MEERTAPRSTRSEGPHGAPISPRHGAPPRHRLLLALAVIILFSEIATFEILMVTPALPEMAAHFRTTDIAWVISIVTLAGATVMPLVGRAADRWGKKRVILILGCAFLAGSLLCATTTSFPLLLAGRAVQGAMVGIVGLSYSLVRDIMPRSYVPVALGMVVTGVGMSAVVGPFVAGFLIDGFGYRGVFWFLVAYMAVLLPLYAALIPESPARSDTRIDYLGSIMFGPAVALGLYGLSRGSEDGWTSPIALALFGGAAVLAVGFVVRQRTAAR
ncbi:MFS transporter [Actinomadura sp. CNU-125]|uniref:MFS transporter n=1 Tax=Actinomadura sp. CNU-125 TaxID=1904961 RepID=UPI0021CC647C|nr:MFS transporter [Actinomadura sp. CNU-125]